MASLPKVQHPLIFRVASPLLPAMIVRVCDDSLACLEFLDIFTNVQFCYTLCQLPLCRLFWFLVPNLYLATICAVISEA